jgi:gamma-glutamyltranspeptidase / glutathione hydrolase
MATPSLPCKGLLPVNLAYAKGVFEQRATDTKARSAQSAHAIVVANDTRATEIGLATLRAGGNAADAFVAASLAETVLFAGVSSIAGFMHVLFYDAKTKQTTYVTGAHRAPLDKAVLHPGRADPDGRAVAIPGAVFGFAEMVRRFGRRPLAEDVAPAASLARDGFYVNALYAYDVALRRKVLESATYGKATYLPAARLPLAGDTLRLPTYADTLDHLGQEGSAYFSQGAWAKEFVEVVNARGGVVSMTDLAGARADVLAPTRWKRDNVDFALAAGPALLGSAAIMLDFEILDSFGVVGVPLTREWIESQARAYAYTLGSESWGREVVIQHPDDIPALVRAHAAKLVKEAGGAPPASSTGSSPNHSSAIVVVDEDGNIAVGMHTINEMPFGKGIFVGGVPLATSLGEAAIPPTPGAELPMLLSPVIAFRGGAPVLALAQFNRGAFPGDVQVMSAILDGKLDVVAAAIGPRVASVRTDMFHDGLPILVVDPRYSRADLCALAEDLAPGAVLEADIAAMNFAHGSLDIVTLSPGKGDASLTGVPAEWFEGRALGY